MQRTSQCIILYKDLFHLIICICLTKGESMRPIEEKLIYLQSRLDDVENELNMLTHKKHELEERRKTLLEKINKLDEGREDTVHQQLFGI